MKSTYYNVSKNDGLEQKICEDFQCLRSIGRIQWVNFVSNSEVTPRLLDPMVSSLEQELEISML